MKKFLVSLIAVIVLAVISSNCSGPSVVYTGELQNKDTIVIVTQPGFKYEVRVIPNFTNIEEEQIKYFVPSLYSTQGEVLAPLADLDGGSYLFGPDAANQDTIHSFTVIKNNIRQTITCAEWLPPVEILCGNQQMSIPCNDAVDTLVINCDEQSE